MKTQTIISIILIIIFVVIPFLKEIFKKEEDEPEEKNDSYEESQSAQKIREYLEKMRSANTTAAPKPDPFRRSTPLPTKMPDKAKAKKRDTYIPKVKEPEVRPQISRAQTESEAAFALPVNPIGDASVIPIAAKVDVVHNIFTDTRFSEVQKALIFHEIFRTPSIFEKKLE